MLDKRSSGESCNAVLFTCLDVFAPKCRGDVFRDVAACPVLLAGNKAMPCCLEKGERDSVWRSSSHPASMPELLSSGCACPLATSSGRRDVFIDTVPEQRQDAEAYKLLILA